MVYWADLKRAEAHDSKINTSIPINTYRYSGTDTH